jgi:glycogen operon protein
VNFVTAHDGFTLADLVSYEQKHNDANGENNNDGANDNHSRNWGAEGPTDDVGIKTIRERSMRNLLATLIFSQGVPMILHGDEIGRTQKGNNNVYAQDNELSWMNWNLSDEQKRLLGYTQRLIALRQANPVLRRRQFFRGQSVSSEGHKDLTWIRPDGQEMTQQEWNNPDNHTLGMLIHGNATDETDDRGRPIKGDTMILLVNGGEQEATFKLPHIDGEGMWLEVVDTAKEETHALSSGEAKLQAFSIQLLRFGSNRRVISEPQLPGTEGGPAQ